MNNIEDEPRKVPQPVPFSQNSPLHPAVPEVSLILQEKTPSASAAEKSSFAGTEFQTYNAWRWKNINEREKENLLARSHQPKKPEFFPIKDKFSGSDIERRKNEILYGGSDEPRRPLPPIYVPEVPTCITGSFSDLSFTNEQWMNNDKYDKYPRFPQCSNDSRNYSKWSQDVMKQIDKSNDVQDIRDLYQIISEQNKQMSFLQKQIEQLLATQTAKEKQIEQLLKVQETKESKIEQLLKMQDLKESHIEQLLKVQEKHEKQIEQLIHIQETKEHQNNELAKQLKKLHKEVKTVSTMTETDVVEKGTSTSFRCQCRRDCHDAFSKRVLNTDESSAESTKCGSGDKSFTLHSLNLPTVHEPVTTPQSSIHVDIPDYNGSSDEESEISCIRKVDANSDQDSKPLGYTFYNNILTQVKDIIDSHEDEDDLEKMNPTRNCVGPTPDVGRTNIQQYTCLRENDMQTGKNRVEKFWGMGIYEETCPDFHQATKFFSNTKGGLQSPFHGRVDYNVTKEPSPSDISMKMNALALKYLKEEQISEYQIESQLQHNVRQPDVTIYNVTNLSFGTMRYLDRHRKQSNENKQEMQAIHSPHKFLQNKARAAFRNDSPKHG